MKKSIYSLVLSILFGSHLVSQQTLVDQHWCSSTKATQAVFLKNPEQKKQFEAHQTKVREYLKHTNKSLLKTTAATNYTIPVVFHILHLNGTENISDVQINDAMRVLNLDFAKQNADTINTIPIFKAIATRSNIRFSLTKKDPSGNCTSGIVRHYDTDANWSYSTNPSYTWDPTKYLNVYIVKSISTGSSFSSAGYTYLPGTWPSGSAEDAIVLLNTYAGTIGTSNNSHNHVLSHEVGHWLGLLHTFGWNDCAVDCNNDDYINDTPTSPGYLSCPNISNPSSYQQCASGVSENFQNIMDYSYCCTMFTYDQVAVMEAETQFSSVGRDNLGSITNLAFTGINPIAACTPVANFQSNKQTICLGQSINFSDLSNVGIPTSWSWTFQGGTPALSSTQNPTVTYNSSGTYSVQLISSNSTGASTPEIKTYYITVLPNPTTSSLIESFEGSSIPNAIWSVKNSSSSNPNWAQTTTAAATGNKSAYVNQTVIPGSVVELYSPTYNFNAMPGVALTLKWAGAERNTTTSDYDVFSVQFSTDCGTSWSPRLNRNIRSATSGVSGIVNGNFLPSASQFVQETIPAGSFTSNTNVLFKLKFTAESGSSNKFYVDDINITSTVGLKDLHTILNLSVYPNPTKNQVWIAFDLLEDEKVEVDVKDVLGRTIQRIPKQDLYLGHHDLAMPLIGVSSGLYFITINVNEVVHTEKLVIE